MKTAVLVPLRHGHTDSQTLRVPIKPVVTVGRDLTRDIVLNDTSVSRDHATIERHRDGYVVVDRGSRNGTRVNGISVARRLLCHGDQIRFGEVEFVFQQIDEREDALPLCPDGAAARERTLPEPEREPYGAATRTISLAENPGAWAWTIVNAWHALRLFGNRPGAPLAAWLHRVVDDLAGLEGVRRVLLFFAPGPLFRTPCWIRASAHEKVSTTLIPEERIVAVAQTGVGFTTSAGRFSALETLETTEDHWQALDTLCLPVHLHMRAAGCLYLEGNDVLSREAVWAAQSVLEAVQIGLAIWSAGAATEPPPGSPGEHSAQPVIVGRSPALLQAVRLAEKAGATDSTVLLRGETGTGKELFARLIVAASQRSTCPFITVHCSAIEETLLGSTLFGHEKGAFTGAVGTRRGLFEEADHGTVFLDEVGELSLNMQIKLLRVLQEGEFLRLGSNKPIRVNVRVIAATNRDLEQAVHDGSFREDLYYRLKVVELRLPPLRERREDIPDLVKHFLAYFSARTDTHVRDIEPEALRLLQEYDWPGNVRELKNVIERGIVLAEGATLTIDDLPPEMVSAAGSGSLRHQNTQPTEHSKAQLDVVEREHIRRVLQECGGNKRLAARRLGISRSTLYAKLRGL